MADLGVINNKKQMKKMKKKKKKQVGQDHVFPSSCSFSSGIKFLPNELLVEIFGKVASQSIVDLCKVKLSCKEFLNAAENDHVYQRASMENFSLVPLPWFTEQKECWFLKRCRESGNLEIAYREGMVEYFSSGDVDRGLEKLKKAAMNGHDEGKFRFTITKISVHHEYCVRFTMNTVFGSFCTIQNSSSSPSTASSPERGGKDKKIQQQQQQRNDDKEKTREEEGMRKARRRRNAKKKKTLRA
ncbi:hypothetical protein Ahy_A01g000967 [Arachis hypogaea]|uniref:F-box domain-containing protein n=1 Tax=Arachis hypogaea TaxID=3818 RepID=A0A445ELP2_ARAHY|nr:hypothetical protein Ahy_A01g000967 [Arachis hypogaea]